MEFGLGKSSSKHFLSPGPFYCVTKSKSCNTWICSEFKGLLVQTEKKKGFIREAWRNLTADVLNQSCRGSKSVSWHEKQDLRKHMSLLVMVDNGHWEREIAPSSLLCKHVEGAASHSFQAMRTLARALQKRLSRRLSKPFGALCLRTG